MNTSRVVICLAVAVAFMGAGQTPGSSVAQPALSERSYPVDPSSFFQLLRKTIDEKEIHSDAEVLRIHFKQNQVDLTPPSSVKFRDETRSVVVTSTAENLAKVEALLPAPPPPAPVLFTRCFALGTNNLFAFARQAPGDTKKQSDIEALRYFFKDKGVELSPPSTLFYTYGENTLLVRSTKENLETIEKLLAELHSGR